MPPATASSSFRDRLTGLTPRERWFLAGGVAAVLMFFLYLIVPSSQEPAEVELTAAPPPPLSTPVVQPVAPAPAALPPPPPAAAPAALGSVILRGVMGGGPGGGVAIIASPDGLERVVRAGREVAPGFVLRHVAVSHIIATSAGGEVRLDLGRPGVITVAKAQAAAAPAAALASVRPAATTASQQRETMQFRVGLQPMRSNGRIAGYSIKAGATVPPLQRAGLQPGDVIVGVNGSQLDEERLMELSWQIANSERTEFEYIRNGRKMKAAISAR